MSSVHHQFELFGFGQTRPRKKVPIRQAQIMRAKELVAEKRYADAAREMRSVREALEEFEKRL